MLKLSLSIYRCGMCCHCSTSRRSSLDNVAVGKGHKSRTRGSKITHRCWIGDGSWNLDGQSRVATDLQTFSYI